MHRRCWISNGHKCPIYGCEPVIDEPEPVFASPGSPSTESGGWGWLGILVWIGLVAVGNFSESTRDPEPDYSYTDSRPEIPDFPYEPNFEDYKMPEIWFKDNDVKPPGEGSPKHWREFIDRLLEDRDEERFDESNEI